MRLSLGVLTILVFPSHARAQNDLDARLSKTFAVIEPVLARMNVPGLVVGVTDREKTLRVFAHGYADLKAKQPVTQATLFEIGSISNPSRPSR